VSAMVPILLSLTHSGPGRRAGDVRHVVMVARPARSGPAAGLHFKREWCAVGDAAPVELDVVQYWDLA